MPHMKAFGLFIEMKQFFFFLKKNNFQLRQFSIFFHENFMHFLPVFELMSESLTTI
jgi:hypothetical protein